MRVLSKTATALAIFLFLSTAAAAQIQVPDPQGMVNDFDGKLSPTTRDSLENLLRNFRDRAGIEVTVVTTPEESLQGYTKEDYALTLGRKWGVGRGSEKLGLLLLIVTKPSDAQGCHGESRLEVSRHLEGDLPDGLAWEVIRRMRDDFKACRFDQAMTTGVQTLLATVAQRRGISMEGIDSSRAYKPPQPRQATRTRGRGISPSLIIFVIFIVFIIISVLGGRGGGGGGGRGRRRRGLGGAEWMLLPIIFGGGGGGWGGSRGGSDWGGGSGWGGGGGGGGGGFGGFGGGGDFGGGGAGDSW